MNLSTEDLNIINEVMHSQLYYYVDEEYRYITYPRVRPFTYIIGSYGNVISLIGKCLMSPFDRKGYDAVSLVSDEPGVRYKVSIHRLVAWEFLEGYNEDNVVNHIDSNTHNNHVSNLEWCTQSQNVYHALNNDNTYFAQRKFTKEDAKNICSLYEQGWTVKEVFKLYTGFEISNEDKSTWVTLTNIYNRKTYKNIVKFYKW